MESSIELGRVPIDANTISRWRDRSVKISLSGSHVFNFFVKFVAQNIVWLPSVLGSLKTSSHEPISRVHSKVFSHLRLGSVSTLLVGSDLNFLEGH